MLIAVAFIVRRTARTQAAAFQTEEDLPVEPSALPALEGV